MKKFKGIKNIIFDFGGVILNINPQLTIDEFKRMNFRNFEETSNVFRNKLFFEQEKGNISENEFFEQINLHLVEKKEINEIENAFNKLLLNFPVKNIQIIKKLKEDYSLFLLSNTNIIHYKKYSAQFLEQFGVNLRDFFKRAYFSHEIGMRKPDKEIFEKVLNDNKLTPSETLFIDDMPENRKAAEKLGIKTIEIDMNEGLDRIFS